VKHEKYKFKLINTDENTFCNSSCFYYSGMNFDDTYTAVTSRNESY